jgi:4-amino-4-deoxy-L-arabinose transferase-like glycosyltransferase
MALGESRPGVAIAAGIFLGVSALVKPIAQVVVAAFLVGWLTSKSRKPSFLLFLFGYAALVMPWMARNYLRHQLFTLSEIGTVDFYFYTAESTLRHRPTSDLANAALNKEIIELTDIWSRQQLTPRERKRKMEQESWNILRHHWPTAVKQSALGFARTCVGTSFITVSDSLVRPPGPLATRALAIVPELQIMFLWLLAIIGAWKGILRAAIDRALRVLLITALILLLLPAASSMGQSRFRIPVVPILCMLAATGADYLLRQLRTSRTYPAAHASPEPAPDLSV